MREKIIRITTVPASLRTLLKGQLRFMNQHYNIIGVSSKGEALEETRHNEGIETYAIEMTRTITPLKDLKATYRLYKFFKKEKPYIVHTHTPKAGTVGMLAARLAGVPHRLHTIAGLPLLEAKGFKRKVLDLVEKITYNNATKVYPNSFGLYDIVIQNKYAKASKLKVIGNGSSNGIDTNHFDPNIVTDEAKNELRNELGFTKEDFVFVFIGRIVTDKGVNELVNVFNKLNKIKDNCRLLLVGPYENSLDPILEQTQTLIEENEQIISVGWQKDIRPYVAISNVLTFPSYREGFPNVVLQASAMGLPCIVTNINGCNEIIKDGFNGIIIPPKDENALFESMIRLAENTEERLKLAKNSRDNIIKKFQQEYIWEELLKEYKSLG
ncbi:MAG: glycosyltransferase family 4 protein [Flavobacteriaceae bacterium]|nr:glycosyltransferase family 4 protein [Flavobacteriaceae bacterium]